MYKFILNPKNNKKIFTNSSLGREIIRKYKYNLSGGNNEIFSDSESEDDIICDEDRCIDQFLDLLENNNINRDAETYDQLGLFSDLNDEEINLVREEIDKILARDDQKLLREYYFDKVREKLISFIDNSDCMNNECIFRFPIREHGNNLDDLIINQFPFLNPELGNYISSNEEESDNQDSDREYNNEDDDNDSDNDDYDSDDDDDESDNDDDSDNDESDSDDEDSDDDDDDDDESDDDDDSDDESDDDDDSDDEDSDENGNLSDATTINIFENGNSINIYPNNNSELVNAVNMYCSDRENAVEIFGDINNWNIVQHFDNGSMTYFDSDIEQSILDHNSDLDENLLSDLRETIDNLSDVDNSSESGESASESDDEEERMIPGQGFNIRRGREHLLEDDTVFAKWEYDDQTDKFMLMGFNTENDEWFQLNFREIEPEGQILITRELLNTLPYGHIPSPSQTN